MENNENVNSKSSLEEENNSKNIEKNESIISKKDDDIKNKSKRNAPSNDIVKESSKNLVVSNIDLNKEIDDSYMEESELKDRVNEINFSKSKNKNIEKDILNDLDNSESKKNKIYKLSDVDNNYFEMYDFLFPGGKLAKMCKINQEEKTISNIPVIMKLLKIDDPNPIIMLLGIRDSGRGKFLAGLTRAAFRTDSIIIDSGISSGIETFCLRREINLIGVFPELCIKMPKINPSIPHPNTLTNGHSLLFMLANKEEWGNEINFKFQLAIELSKGSLQKRQEMVQCKIVGVFTGEHENSKEDLIKAIESEIPIIIVKGSDISDNIINYLKKEKYILSDDIKNILDKGHFFPIESNKSEDLASIVHFLLTVKPY